MKSKILGMIFIVFLINGCASRFPTEKEWTKVPIVQREKTESVLQGNFKDINEFLQAADQLKEGLSLEEVKKLGFNNEDKNGCDKIGWLEASDIILANTNLMIDFRNIESMTAEKKQYEGIKCKAADLRVRADRMFAYFNNHDTYRLGRDIKLVLIFKNKTLVGININIQPIKEYKRESAFGKIIGDIFSPPKIEPILPIVK